MIEAAFIGVIASEASRAAVTSTVTIRGNKAKMLRARPQRVGNDKGTPVAGGLVWGVEP